MAVVVVELYTGGKQIALPDSGAAVGEVLHDSRRASELSDGAIPSMPVEDDARRSVAGEVGARR